MPQLLRRLFQAFAVALVLCPSAVPAETRATGTEICIGAPFDSGSLPDQLFWRDLLEDLHAVLSDYPSLQHSLNVHVTQICLSDQLFAAKAYLETDDKRIVLAQDMSPGLMLAILIHEIRHADQLARGACPSDDLAMAQYARATFALEADANVVSLIIAWQQKTEGNASLWDALAAWPMVSDLAARFQATMDQTRDISAAATAAFDQWYASDKRRDIYYVASCSDYLDRQEQSHALPRYLLLPTDYLSRLCLMPDGRRYNCEEPQGALAR